MKQKTFGLDAFALKCIMAFLMVLDHLHQFIPGMPEWFTWLGRLVAPSFCFLMTQGLVYTKNRTAYIGRLFAAGAIMAGGNIALFFIFGEAPPNNIFLALAVSAGMITCLDQLKAGDGRVYTPLVLIAFVVASVYTEGSIIIPAMALVFYYLRDHKAVMCIVYIGVMLALVPALWKSSFPQIIMIGAAVPIYFYNGSRGRQGKVAKYFFYSFYPAHIWTIFILGKLF